MDINESVQLLHEAYHNAPKGTKGVGLHLYVKYGCELEELQRLSASSRTDLLKMLVARADVGESFKTEINKGINLSEYVMMKEDNLWF